MRPRRRKTVRHQDDFLNDKERRYLELAMKNSLKETKLEVDTTLPPCPVFYPTEAEFSDPMRYMDSIRAEGAAAGICKIVPPPSWKLAPPRLTPNYFSTKKQTLHRLQEGAAYGTGQSYTGTGYKQMADDFMDASFPDLVPRLPHSSLPKEEAAALEAAVEQAYWRIVETGCQNVSVEYGNDLDTKRFGSGFPYPPHRPHPDVPAPTMRDADFYERTGWNLHNLPHQSASVLRHVREELNGVNVPWLYFGMLFATFAWHNEDNYFYSMNYMHCGAPKTWYGIKADHATLFETEIRARLRARFEEDRDLLYHLTTVFPPCSLRRSGVDVVHTVQHPGEFVVTFPQAYHSGFSHGWNAAEACNFALADWIPFGRVCINRYRSYKRPSVLVHEQLILDMAAHPYDHPKDSCADLIEELKAIRKNAQQERELAVFMHGVTDGGHSVSEMEPDRDCISCNTACFMSIVRCADHPHIVSCGRHSRSVCFCPQPSKVFHERVPDSKLASLIEGVRRRLRAADKAGASAGLPIRIRLSTPKPQPQLPPEPLPVALHVPNLEPLPQPAWEPPKLEPKRPQEVLTLPVPSPKRRAMPPALPSPTSGPVPSAVHAVDVYDSDDGSLTPLSTPCVSTVASDGEETEDEMPSRVTMATAFAGAGGRRPLVK